LSRVINRWEGCRAGEGVRQEEGDDEWARAISGREREGHTSSESPEWVVGWNEAWAERFVPAFLPFFCSFSIFPFLISLLFQNLFIIAPNELKSNSKIF
jgi:hypothetical protein